jgi:hypothetical protein
VWREGDWILLRSVYRERVRWAFMHRVIDADPVSLVLYLPTGSPGASMGRDPDGRYLERWVRATDLALDVTVELDGTWAWKDEDDFAEAIALGVLSADEAAAVRAEGERVVAVPPALLPTGWEDWRPDPAWQLPELPTGWDSV